MTRDRRTRAAEQTPAMAPSAAHRTTARRSRSDLILHAAAVVAGSAIGGALALRGGPASPPGPAAGRSGELRARSQQTAAPVAPPPPSSRSRTAGSAGSAQAAAAATAAELHAALAAQIEDALSRFIAWSHDHLGAPCPDPGALGAAALDPWGHPLRIVCADQPADQIAGVLSLGPDGLPGTRDDVVSWALGAGVTELVRGPRWSSTWRAAPAAAAKPRTGPAPRPVGSPAPPAASHPARPAAPPPASAGAGSRKPDGDGIPDRR